MLIHSVYFWLKQDLTKEQKEKFRDGLLGLEQIGVEALYVGSPSPTTRPVVENSYDYALVVLLKDMADHDRYQAHEVHQQFVKEYSSFWDKLKVFDPEDKS